MTDARSASRRTLELIGLTVPFFERKGVDNPRLNAELLLAHALQCQRIELYTRFEEPLATEAVDAFRELVRRRGEREPLQAILGQTEFRGITVRCDSRAMIPRRETEMLVDLAAGFLRGRAAPLAAEVGVGTGCVTVALAAAVPDVRVAGTDVSPGALELARLNAEENGVADRVRLLLGDLCAPLLAEGLAGQLDLLVSNPPYVRSEDIAGLQPEVRDHDPRVALDGGPDGLAFYRRLFAEAPPLMKPGGAILVETPDQGQDEIGGIAEAEGWGGVERTRDFAEVERFLSAVMGQGG